MILTNQQSRAMARLRQGPCLAFDIGDAAGVLPRHDGDREAIGRRGARIAAKLVAAGLARSSTKAGLTVYGLTRKGCAL